MSTFPWSRHGVESLREKHPDQPWVLKPHPGMRSSVVKNGVMAEEEYGDYLSLGRGSSW